MSYYWPEFAAGLSGHRLASDVYDLRRSKTPVMTGVLKTGKDQRPSLGPTTLLTGVLEQWRATPAEGVHSDEVR